MLKFSVSDLIEIFDSVTGTGQAQSMSHSHSLESLSHSLWLQEAYTAQWGGGCRQSPVSCEEWADYINSSGWVSREQLYNNSDDEPSDFP